MRLLPYVIAALFVVPVLIAGEKESLKVSTNGTAQVIGTVLKNDQGCVTDLECFLMVRVAADKVRVVYQTGRGAPCVNQEASHAGAKTKVGAVIEAYGKYSKRAGVHEISTCQSATFYIQTR